jgi:ATP synthase protein I
MSGPPDEFAARLRAAKERQAARAGAGPSAADRRGMGAGFRIAVDLVAGIVVGVGMGWALDYWLGTKPWLLVVFTLFGFAAGVLNVMRTAKQLDLERAAEKAQQEE